MLLLLQQKYINISVIFAVDVNDNDQNASFFPPFLLLYVFILQFEENKIVWDVLVRVTKRFVHFANDADTYWLTSRCSVPGSINIWQTRFHFFVLFIATLPPIARSVTLTMTNWTNGLKSIMRALATLKSEHIICHCGSHDNFTASCFTKKTKNIKRCLYCKCIG